MQIDSIHAVADDFPLTERQRIACDAVKTGRLWTDRNLATELDDLKYPIYSMGFETVNPALPRFAGTRPYDIIPFQWSVRRLDTQGAEPQHFEFLASDDTDPRAPFIESLIDALKDSGTIIVYNASFESTRLQEIADYMPRYAGRISSIQDRIWDLLQFVRCNVYHPAFAGSYSLKRVLPALLPEMTYEGMEVANGDDAGIAFTRMLDTSLPSEDRNRLRAALFAIVRRIRSHP